MFSASKWNITETQGTSLEWWSVDCNCVKGTWTVKRISATPQDNMLEVLKPHTNDGGRVLWQYQTNDTPFNINGRNEKKRTSNMLKRLF